MQQLFVNEYIDVTQYGASCPVVIKASDGNTYVLKTRYQSNLNTDENEIASVLLDASIYIESLTYLLLQNIGFEYIPEIALIDIDDSAINDAARKFDISSTQREQMALKNISYSKGLNLGIKWIEDSEGAFSKFEKIPKRLYETAINYDAYVLNVDRDESNPNVLFSKKDNKFYLIDFGNAFEHLSVFEDIYSDGDSNLNEVFDKFIFDEYYLFFEHVTKATKYRKTFSQSEILDIMSELPSQWKPNSISDHIAKVLSKRIGNKEIFEDA